MALLGGGVGGAGNPTGGSFTGPAQALEIYGDWCLSYSGAVDVTSSSTTMNTFTTGNYLAIIEIELHGDYNGMGTDVGELQVLMNGSEIVNTQFTRITAMTNIEPIKLVIPAYTELVVNMNTGSGSPTNWQTTITGELIRDRV